MVTFHLLKCLTVPCPQKSLGIVKSTALLTTCGHCSSGETPVFRSACCVLGLLCWEGRRHGPRMLRLQVLVDTLMSQFCSRGDRWAALTHSFPRSRLQLIYLPVHSPTNGFVEHLLSGSSV